MSHKWVKNTINQIVMVGIKAPLRLVFWEYKIPIMIARMWIAGDDMILNYKLLLDAGFIMRYGLQQDVEESHSIAGQYSSVWWIEFGLMIDNNPFRIGGQEFILQQCP